jgi:cyclopropane-fatty-acyl-phospholipid synthase
MTGAIAKSSQMKLVHLEDIGPSYALTLREWRKRFLERETEVRALNYPDAFIKMWDYYLAYCEGGFLERTIGDVQMLLAKPRNRRAEFLPDLQQASHS